MSEPRVIVHVADLHLGRRAGPTRRDGFNLRESDVYRAARVVARHIADVIKPDLVIDAGDRWDTPWPTAQALAEGYDFEVTLREAGIPTVHVGGNHDHDAIVAATPLAHLEKYFGARVALQRATFDVAGLAVHCYPYRAIGEGEIDDPDLSRETPNVLVAHTTVDGEGLPSFAGYGDNRLPRHLLDDRRFALGVLGHVHIHQPAGVTGGPPFYYSGALERLNWKEIVNEPAIYVHRVHPDGRVDTESVPVASMGEPLTPRPRHDLTVDCEGLTAEECVDKAVTELDARDLDEHLVQLSFANPHHELPQLQWEDLLAKRASAGGAVLWRFPSPDIVLDAETTAAQLADRDTGLGGGLTLVDRFRAYVLAREEEPEIAELGAELIGRVLSEAAA